VNAVVTSMYGISLELSRALGS